MTASPFCAILLFSCESARPEELPMHPSALKTKITTPLLARTRDFYVTCLGLRIVEEWREEEDAGCILALARDGREALLEIYEGDVVGWHCWVQSAVPN